jgi:phenylalanyl-tRNA synthetase alpha chain
MSSLPDQIGQLRSHFLTELNCATHTKDLESLKTKYLGKKGPIQALMINLKDCSTDERPHFGKLINDLKEELVSHYENSFARLQNEELSTRLSQEWIDATLPGKKALQGGQHPITQTLNRAIDILIGMGFSVKLGPDVDTDFYNFEGLNFAKDHPARDMQDTFYLAPSHNNFQEFDPSFPAQHCARAQQLDASCRRSPHNTEQKNLGANSSENFCGQVPASDLLLRTHTSNTQVHAMQNHTPPIRMIAPGRCFRNEDISARSHVFFHQIEGFYIDKNVTFADLLSTMDEFLSKFLGEKVETRYRPSYFPFVEPGLEVDVRCTSCKGSGCRICKHTGWLEILGAGLIHPEVLKKGNIDPEVYSGYAWGMGIERLTMLLGDIRDIRLFTENDLRFLEQFP